MFVGIQDYVVSLSNDQMGLSRIDLGVAPSEILNVAADPGTERCKKKSVWDVWVVLEIIIELMEITLAPYYPAIWRLPYYPAIWRLCIINRFLLGRY